MICFNYKIGNTILSFIIQKIFLEIKLVNDFKSNINKFLSIILYRFLKRYNVLYKISNEY